MPTQILAILISIALKFERFGFPMLPNMSALDLQSLQTQAL